MRLVKGLETNKIFFLAFTKQDDDKSFLSLIKRFKNKKICYITSDKSSKIIIGLLRKDNIDHKEYFFIDLISKKGYKDKNIIYVQDGNKDIETILYQIIRSDYFDIIIIDTPSKLRIYSDKKTLNQFSTDIKKKIEEKREKTMFNDLKEEFYNKMIKHTQLKIYYDNYSLPIDILKNKAITVLGSLSISAVISLFITRYNILSTTENGPVGLVISDSAQGTNSLFSLFFIFIVISFFILSLVIAYKGYLINHISEDETIYLIPSSHDPLQLREEVRKKVETWVKCNTIK